MQCSNCKYWFRFINQGMQGCMNPRIVYGHEYQGGKRDYAADMECPLPIEYQEMNAITPPEWVTYGGWYPGD